MRKAPKGIKKQVARILVANTIFLSIEDTPEDVSDKRLYRVGKNHNVAIFDGEQLIMLTTADALRSRILPMTWAGCLGNYINEYSVTRAKNNGLVLE